MNVSLPTGFSSQRSWHCKLTCAVVGVLFLVLGITSNPIRTWAQNDAGGARGIYDEQGIYEEDWKVAYHGFNLVIQQLDFQVVRDRQRWFTRPARQRLAIVLGPIPDWLDVVGLVQQGGNVLVASDADESGKLRPVRVGLSRRLRLVADPEDALAGHADCPIIRDLDDSHPVTTGLSAVVANVPGHVYSRRSGSRRFNNTTLARFPRLNNGAIGVRFAVASHHDSGGRMLLVADQSMFSNQMLLQGDNARFLIQSLNWLSADRENSSALRRPVAALVVINGRVAQSLDMSEMHVVLPPPTKEQVLQALEQMPPDLLLEFGNAAASIIGDEGIANEFVAQWVGDLSARHYLRILVIALSVLMGCIAIWFLFTNRLDEDADDPQVLDSRRYRKSRAAAERRLAAARLLDDFSMRHFNRPLTTWEQFDREVQTSNDCEWTPQSIRQLDRWRRQVTRGPARTWTKSRLRRLAAYLESWDNQLSSVAGA